LRSEVETPDRVQLVAPPFETCRRRHAEAVYVDDAAPDTELGYLGHRGDPAITHRFESSGSFGEGTAACLASIGRAGPEAKRLLGEGGRDSGALQGRPGGGDQDSEAALEQGGNRFHPLARDLIVRLFLTQRLTLGIERDRHIGEVLQIAEPTLGVGRRRADDGQQPLGRFLGEPGGQHGSARAGEAANPDLLPSTGESLPEIESDRGSAQCIEQSPQRHVRRLQPLASSTSVTCQREGEPQQRSLEVGSPDLGERLGSCVSRFNDPRAGPERAHLAIAGRRKLRFAGIEIGREDSDRVPTAEQIVEAHLRRPKRRATFDRPTSGHWR
jgi:hypothetical protein